MFCAKLKRHHCLLALSTRLISLVPSAKTTQKKKNERESKINLRDGKDDGREIMHRRRNTVKESLLTYSSATSSIAQKREESHAVSFNFPRLWLCRTGEFDLLWMLLEHFPPKNKEKCLNYSIAFLLNFFLLFI